jgi:fructose-bisphosphate aldolase, class II
MYPHIPVCMHQDHGATPGVCARSIQSGFSSVMMDGSLLADGKTPASYDYNVAHDAPGGGPGPCLRRVGGR